EPRGSRTGRYRERRTCRKAYDRILAGSIENLGKTCSKSRSILAHKLARNSLVVKRLRPRPNIVFLLTVSIFSHARQWPAEIGSDSPKRMAQLLLSTCEFLRLPQPIH